MEPPIEPAEHTVAELRDLLDDVDDPEALEAILEAEESGENRTTARESIEERLESVDAAMVEARDELQALDLDDGGDVLTVAGPEEDRELSERLLGNLEGIRNTLEDARQSGGRHEARLRQLENEVGDLAAYTDALEEFLDEDGTAQQVLDSVQDDLEAVSADVNDLKPVIRSHARSLRDHQQTIADLEADLDAQRASINDLGSDLDSLATDFEEFSETASETHAAQANRLDDLEDGVDDQADRIGSLETEIDTVADAVDGLRTDVGDLEADVEDRFGEAADGRDALADRIASNAEAVDENADTLDQVVDGLEELEGTVGESGPVDDRFEEIEAQIEALEEWRDQVRSVMAGAVGSPAPAASESDE